MVLDEPQHGQTSADAGSHAGLVSPPSPPRPPTPPPPLKTKEAEEEWDDDSPQAKAQKADLEVLQEERQLAQLQFAWKVSIRLLGGVLQLATHVASAWIQCSKLKYDKLRVLSSCAFNVSLRPYSPASCAWPALSFSP